MTVTPGSNPFEYLEESCLFCDPAAHGQQDRVILRSDNFYLFAGLGAIRQGYIIVTPYSCSSPERPATSLSALSTVMADELAFLRGIISNYYRDRYGQPGMSFEHGRAGTCFSTTGGTPHCYHGHLCCYPTSCELLDADELKSFRVITVERYFDLGEATGGTPYLFVEHCTVNTDLPNDHVGRETWTASVIVLSREDELESQLLRKLLARRVGMPDMWDWRRHPTVEEAEALVVDFRTWLRQSKQMERYAIEWQEHGPRIDYVASVVRCNQVGNDYVAREYQETWKDKLQPGAIGRFLRQFRDNQKGRSRVLDAGCGPGAYTHALAAVGLSVVGIDVSAAMVGLARTGFGGRRDENSSSASVALAQMDVLNLGFREKSFDGIWLSAVWVHVPRATALGLLQALRRLLRDGGVIYLSAQTGSGSVFQLEGRVFFYYPDADMRRLFREAGLEIIETWAGELSEGTCGDTRVKYWRHYLVGAPATAVPFTTDSRVLGAIGERVILGHIQKWLERGAQSKSVILGAGDDAAVVAVHPGNVVIATSDHCPTPVVAMLGDNDPWYRGWYSMVISLSDLAAMGARPLGMLLAVEAPRDMTLVELGRFYEGVLDASREFDCPVIGGNLREGPVLNCVSTAFGEAAPERLLRRDFARPGDLVVVLGDMGLFWAGTLARLRAAQVSPLHRPELDRNLQRPRPRIREGRLIAERGLSVCAIDSSDGLIASFKELACGGATLDLHIDITKCDVHPAVKDVAVETGFDVRKLLFSWGDWQLVCTCTVGVFAALAEAVSTLSCPVHKVGWVTEGTGRVWYHDEVGTAIMAGLPNERFTPGSYFSHDLNDYLSLLERTPLAHPDSAGGSGQ